MRKQITAFDKQAKDESNKANEAARSAAEAMEAYQYECQSIGIQGKSLDTEILDLVNEVPPVFKAAASKLFTEKIGTFIKFYQEYCKYLLGESHDDTKRLTHLSYVQEFGDTITDLVELRLTGTATIPSELLARDEKKYAIYDSFSKLYQQSISTDFIVIENADTSLSASQGGSNVVPPEETLFSQRELRDLLLNDIVESEAFIKRRVQELKGTEQATFMTYEQGNKPEILQHNDNVEFLNSVAQDLQEAYQTLTSKRLFTLLNIKHNPAQSKDRMKGKLERRIEWAEKYEREKKWHESKEGEIRSELEKCKEKLEKELKVVEELKADAQKGIADVFKCTIDIA